MIREYIKNLKLPKNEILFLHARLKGLESGSDYQEITKQILGYLEDFYSPKTILIPTFTYSFTETGCFNRVETPSEVGRFSEESRRMFSSSFRSMNPVFSVVDTKKYYISRSDVRNDTAFGEKSLFNLLSVENHIVINFNLEQLFSTFFHYIEQRFGVDYRFMKYFSGTITDGDFSESIVFDYYVRRYEIDTGFRRSKIELDLGEKNLIKYVLNKQGMKWIYSSDLFAFLQSKIEFNQRYLIED